MFLHLYCTVAASQVANDVKFVECYCTCILSKMLNSEMGFDFKYIRQSACYWPGATALERFGLSREGTLLFLKCWTFWLASSFHLTSLDLNSRNKFLLDPMSHWKPNWQSTCACGCGVAISLTFSFWKNKGVVIFWFLGCKFEVHFSSKKKKRFEVQLTTNCWMLLHIYILREDANSEFHFDF